MSTYYKAVRPDGTDFYSAKVQWTPPEGHVGEWIVCHPTATEVGDDASEYLSVSTEPTDCTGMRWPCRLLTVEPVDGSEPVAPTPKLPNKRAAVAWRVIRELDATLALGPQRAQVAALIERAGRLTSVEARRLVAAGDAARGAARGAACALVVRDLISREHYDVLTRPWRTIIGPIHPDDPDIRA